LSSSSFSSSSSSSSVEFRSSKLGVEDGKKEIQAFFGAEEEFGDDDSSMAMNAGVKGVDGGEAEAEAEASTLIVEASVVAFVVVLLLIAEL